MTRDDGGPAFPYRVIEKKTGPGGVTYEQKHTYSGMTLRDYFAAQALPQVVKVAHGTLADHTPEQIANTAYKLADAMLEAREGDDQ